MQEGDLPAYLMARTPMGLRLLCFKNNVKHGITFHYFDFQQLSNGRFICWFYLPSVKVVIESFTEEAVK